MTPKQQEALDAYKVHGSYRKAAKALGISYGAIYNHVKAAERYIAAPEGQKAAIEASGLDINRARHGWRVVQHDDGSRDSVFWKADDPEKADIIESIKEAFEDVPRAPTVAAPEYANADLLTLYPVTDAHIGMMAWGRETGEDYNTEKAVSRLQNWIGNAIDASPPSETAIILDDGDLTHADDETNQTPRSKHALDVDTRHYKTLDMAITAYETAIQLALRKHRRVIVRILPGNHNPHAYLGVMFALASRYRDEPRVKVQKVPGEFFVHQFGNVMIAAHHGDKAKADRLVMFLADEFSSVWGKTTHRFLFTGHLHHHKSQDIGGMRWEQLRAITARDSYAVSHAYSARAELQAITYHRDRGEIGRVKFTA